MESSYRPRQVATAVIYFPGGIGRGRPEVRRCTLKRAPQGCPNTIEDFRDDVVVAFVQVTSLTKGIRVKSRVRRTELLRLWVSGPLHPLLACSKPARHHHAGQARS